MRRVLLGLTLAVTLPLALALPAAAATRTVTVDSFFFEDSSTGDGKIVVDKGDAITFRFEGNNEHSATVEGLFDSGVKSGGMSFTTGVLMRAGSFSLFCTEHGAQQHGSTLIVRDPAAQPTSATPRPTSAKPSPARSAAPRPAAPPAKSTVPAAPPKPSKVPAKAAPAPGSAKAAPAVSPTPTLLSEPEALDTEPASKRNLLLPGALVLVLLLGAGGYALNRRSRTV